MLKYDKLVCIIQMFFLRILIVLRVKTWVMIDVNMARLRRTPSSHDEKKRREADFDDHVVST